MTFDIKNVIGMTPDDAKQYLWKSGCYPVVLTESREEYVSDVRFDPNDFFYLAHVVDGVVDEIRVCGDRLWTPRTGERFTPPGCAFLWKVVCVRGDHVTLRQLTANDFVLRTVTRDDLKTWTPEKVEPSP